MTEITIEYSKEREKYIQAYLSSKLSNSLYSIRKNNEELVIRFTGSLFSSSEIEVFNYIQKMYNILKIKKVSRSFRDVHGVSDTKEFQQNIEAIKNKISPYYIIKKDLWWVGIKDQNPKDFNLQKTIREIYKIGVCCGLVPTSLI